MTRPLRLVFLGLSLSSSWGNGHATTYRALIRALAARGHDVLFLECDQPWYAEHRDLPSPAYCRLAFYRSVRELDSYAREIERADAVIVGSFVPDGIAVGAFVQRRARHVTAFYDIDTPVTLAKLARGECDYLAPYLVPGYEIYLSFTGGPTLTTIERVFGSPAAHVLYCSADPLEYRPIPGPKRFALGYLGTYSADRQPALEALLIEPARRRPDLGFVVAGAQFPATIAWPENVTRLDHVAPADHPAFYGSLAFALNITRTDMVRAGYSPSVRLFEAAACATAIISDAWNGLDHILEPDREILVAHSTGDVLAALALPPDELRRLGDAARRRVFDAHTAGHRAAALEQYVEAALARRRGVAALFAPGLRVAGMNQSH